MFTRLLKAVVAILMFPIMMLVTINWYMINFVIGYARGVVQVIKNTA